MNLLSGVQTMDQNVFYLVDMEENEDEGCELVTGSDFVEVVAGDFFVLSFSSFIFGPNHFWCIWPQNDFIDFIWPKNLHIFVDFKQAH